MVSYKLSIIIPNYNTEHVLPKMLDSIMAQSLKDLEVIVADGGSIARYDDLIDSYNNKGLNIRMIRPAPGERAFVHHSRAMGLQAAQGQVLYFVDADDTLVGTEVLERHTHMVIEKNLDILHCGSKRVDADNNFMHEIDGCFLGDFLEGSDICSAFSRRPQGHVLWAMMFSRDLCLRVASEPLFWHKKVGHYDDLYFASFCFFYANRYGSSQEIGYSYCDPGPKHSEMLAEAIPTTYVLISEVAPLFRRKGFSEDAVHFITQYYYYKLTFQLNQLVGNLMKLENTICISDELLAVLASQAYGLNFFSKSLLAGYDHLQAKYNHIHSSLEHLKRVNNSYCERIKSLEEQIKNADTSSMQQMVDNQASQILGWKNKYEHLLKRTEAYRKFVKFCKTPIRYFKDAGKK